MITLSGYTSKCRDMVESRYNLTGCSMAFGNWMINLHTNSAVSSKLKTSRSRTALYVTVTLFACQTPVISLWGCLQQEGAGEGMVGKNNGNFEMPFSWHNYHIDVCAVIFLPLQRRPLSIPPRPSQPSWTSPIVWILTLLLTVTRWTQLDVNV